MAELPLAVRKLIAAFERLPGVGPKSASRLVFYLLNTPESFLEDFAQNIVDLKTKTTICRQCYSVSEKEVCQICADSRRDQKQICVVERALDVVAIERTGAYGGVYHVLGGIINPLEHIGPEDIRIEELIARVAQAGDGVEVILAMNPTMEGEATALYIKKRLDGIEGLRVSRIGSGLPIGGDVEFADQATLNRAIEGRREI